MKVFKDMLLEDLGRFADALAAGLGDLSGPTSEWHYPLWCEVGAAFTGCEWSCNKVLEKAEGRYAPPSLLGAL